MVALHLVSGASHRLSTSADVMGVPDPLFPLIATRGDAQRMALETQLGFGCWAIGGPFGRPGAPAGWGEVDDAESIAAIRKGLDLGVTLFDTADVYGTGRSEKILGKALKGEDVAIATKFGNTFEEGTGLMTGVDLSAAYIRKACEASLRRLQTDRIDFYQCHKADRKSTRLNSSHLGISYAVFCLKKKKKKKK